MATAVSGFITIATAGTALAGPASGPGTFLIIANPANTGTYCYMGDDGAGDVASTNGYPLSKTLGNQVVVTVGPGGLAEYMFDSDTNNDDLIYLRIAGEGDGVPAV